MDIGRRDLVTLLGAAPAALLPGVAGAAKLGIGGGETVPGADSGIERSIRANFGGGFAVRSHMRTGGLTYADIEHAGNRYVVSTADRLDWKIVASDRTL